MKHILFNESSREVIGWVLMGLAMIIWLVTMFNGHSFNAHRAPYIWGGILLIVGAFIRPRDSEVF
jgi:hypothetical protein